MFVFIISLELQLNALCSKFIMLNLKWIYQIFRKYYLFYSVFNKSFLLLFSIFLFNFRNLRDPYLVKLEQMLRAFCLKLTVSDTLLNPLPFGCTFQIHIHTTETCSIEIQKDTEVCTNNIFYYTKA